MTIVICIVWLNFCLWLSRKELNDTELGKLLSDDIKLKRIFRQHIIFYKHEMILFGLGYNLQGNPAKQESVSLFYCLIEKWTKK